MAQEEDDTGRDYDRARRRFLQLAAAGVIGAGATVLFSGEITTALGIEGGDPRTTVPQKREWVMLIDLAKCDGCGECTKGCAKMHFVPPGQEWIKVYEVKDEFGQRHFLPRPCMHCENAPCQKVCPVGATFQKDDGRILIDHNRCIGCRYCMAACPYDVRAFNWSEPPHTPEELAHPYSPEAPWPHRRGTVEKCDFCGHDAEKGSLPGCVQACTEEMGNGAIYFGDLREDAVSNGVETLPFSETIRKEQGFRLKEELGTGPHVWYLPARR